MPNSSIPNTSEWTQLPSTPRLDLLNGLCLFLWFAYIVFSPIYLFPSGIPQPSDWVCAFLIGILIVLGQYRLEGLAKPVVRRLGLFVAYAALINTIWFVLLSALRKSQGFAGQELLLASLYYTFNLCVAMAAGSLLRWLEARFLNLFLFALIASTLFQAWACFATGSYNEEGERTTAFFENPNQLAYFGVLNASLIIAIARSGLVHRALLFVVPPTFLALLYIAISSSSRAGLAGVGLACMIMYFDSIRRGVLISLILGGVALTGFWTNIGETLMDRSVEKNNSFWEEMAYRGYDRLWNHPNYLVFGSGEGDYERFRSALPFELHSTPGTILFSYGIVGTILFLLPVVFLYRHGGIRPVLLLLPILVYGLTHQGLRQAELWILFVLVSFTCRSSPSLDIENDSSDVEIGYAEMAGLSALDRQGIEDGR